MSTIRSGIWRFDPAHTRIRFTVRHLMSKVHGNFGTVTGVLETAHDITASTCTVEIDLSSVNVGNEKWNNHLRAGDTFSARTQPKMTFVTTEVERRSGTDFTVQGDFTVRDISRSAVLDLEYLGEAKDPWGGTRIGIEATAQLSRRAWGIDIDVPWERAKVVIGNRVTLQLDAEAILQE